MLTFVELPMGEQQVKVQSPQKCLPRHCGIKGQEISLSCPTIKAFHTIANMPLQAHILAAQRDLFPNRDSKTQIKTKVLVLSDTHGQPLKHNIDTRPDIVVHCGDFTEESKLHEFRTAIELLKSIDAPIKLVIAGNHDLTLDDRVYEEARRGVAAESDHDTGLLDRVYVKVGEARELFETEEAKTAGVYLLDEGNYEIELTNGALLSLYASPYTASRSSGWGFSYDPEDGEKHRDIKKWDVWEKVDLIMTHSPPLGVLDRTESLSRAGSASLFRAMARVRPKVHCFGHIHEAWGARLVTWQPVLSDWPTHFHDIDNEASELIEKRSTLQAYAHDKPHQTARKLAKRQSAIAHGYYEINDHINHKDQTLFVNAAIQDVEEDETQVPWLVSVDLPRNPNARPESDGEQKTQPTVKKINVEWRRYTAKLDAKMGSESRALAEDWYDQENWLEITNWD